MGVLGRAAGQLVHTRWIAVLFQGSELATPEASGIGRPDLVRLVQAQGGPMAEHQAVFTTGALWVVEPGQQPRRLTADRALLLQRQASLCIAETKSGEGVGDEAQSIHAG